MKPITLFIFLLTALISQNTFSQELKESEVPKVVRDSFRAKYPDVYVYEWEWKKKKRVFEAEFMIEGEEYEAYFTRDGVWIKTERDIKGFEVPQNVWDSLDKTEYAHWKIDDIEEHSTPKYKLIYEIEVKTKRPYKRKVYLYFLPNGKLVDKFEKR